MERAEADEKKVRIQKLNELRRLGVVYKDKFDRTHLTSQIKEDSLRDGVKVLEGAEEKVKIVGRILSIRDHGGIKFFDLQDPEGEMQVSINENSDGKDIFDKYIDPGDFVGIVGEPFVTKKDVLSVHVKKIELLSKSLNPLPSKHFSVTDPEIRYRKRYLDMTLNKEVKDRIVIKSKFVQAVREWLLEKNFLEITTRVLQPKAGGAMAETFSTHHNALDYDFNLRISNELDLKMAIAGGLDRVFEFAIVFRNEGIDNSHLQEFQMLEWYASCEDYETGMKWTEEMLRYAVEKSIGKTTFKVGNNEIDLGKRIERVKYSNLLKKYGIDINEDIKELQKIAEKLGIENIDKRSRGNLIDDIYKKKVRGDLVNPIFVTNLPSDMLPLARVNDEDPTVTDSYQLVINGTEIVKGYSELIDPEQQREAFKKQKEFKAIGDKEAMDINEEFLTAMEHGIPPVCGFGMGVERVITLLTDAHNIKESVMFPLLLPKNKE